MPLVGEKARQHGTLRHQMSRPRPEIVSLDSTGGDSGIAAPVNRRRGACD